MNKQDLGIIAPPILALVAEVATVAVLSATGLLPSVGLLGGMVIGSVLFIVYLILFFGVADKWMS